MPPSGPITENELAFGAVMPWHEALRVKNVFAGTLAVGTLVYVNGTTTNPSRGQDVFATVTKSSATGTSPANQAMYVVTRAMTQNSYGTVSRYFVQRGVNTSSWATVGDPAYLDSTAGATTATAPAGTVQRVGYVAVKSATAGIIVYDLRNARVTTSTTASTFGDGTAAAPSMTFTADQDTGWFRPGSNQIAAAIGGVLGLTWSGASISTALAADNTAGSDVYVKAASGGANATAPRSGGGYNLAAGDGSAGSGTVPGGGGGPAALVGGSGGSKAGTGAAAGGAGANGTVQGGNGGNTASAGTDAGGNAGAGVVAGGTAGNATAGTGNGGRGGDVLLQATAGGTSAGGQAGKAGVVRVPASLITPIAQSGQAAQAGATVANAGTISAAQHRGQQVYQDASGGNVTMTTQSGANLDAEFPTLQTGNFVLLFCASNHPTNTSTVSGGAGVTLVGSGALTQTGGTFILRKTGSATYDLVRVG